MPRLLQAGLLQAGVPDVAISAIADANEALNFSLELAGEGDLLVLLAGSKEITSLWTLLKSYHPGGKSALSD